MDVHELVCALQNLNHEESDKLLNKWVAENSKENPPAVAFAELIKLLPNPATIELGKKFLMNESDHKLGFAVAYALVQTEQPEALSIVSDWLVDENNRYADSILLSLLQTHPKEFDRTARIWIDTNKEHARLDTFFKGYLITSPTLDVYEWTWQWIKSNPDSQAASIILRYLLEANDDIEFVFANELQSFSREWVNTHSDQEASGLLIATLVEAEQRDAQLSNDAKKWLNSFAATPSAGHLLLALLRVGEIDELENFTNVWLKSNPNHGFFGVVLAALLKKFPNQLDEEMIEEWLRTAEDPDAVSEVLVALLKQTNRPFVLIELKRWFSQPAHSKRSDEIAIMNEGNLLDQAIKADKADTEIVDLAKNWLARHHSHELAEPIRKGIL